MKGIAIILTGCFLLLGAENLLLEFDLSEQAMETCCASTCDHEEEDQACDMSHECIPGCDCSCHFQITATPYNYQELPGLLVQSYHFGGYLNSYTFEFSSCFLHPPRFS